VTTSPEGNHLADKRYVIVCLRMLINREGKMMYGEIVGPESDTQSRFLSWAELTEAVQLWLASRSKP
jgi:hypothetical protein